MPSLLDANKVLQLSHMEILSEGGRPEPRLRRLLGHISAYDNVEQWRKDNGQQIFIAEIIRGNETRPTPAARSIYYPRTSPPESKQKLRTLADFQAAMRAHLQAEQQTTVSAEEVFSDSDSEHESESVESLSDGSDDESAWSDEDDPIIELITEETRLLLQQPTKEDVMIERSIMSSSLQTMEKR